MFLRVGIFEKFGAVSEGGLRNYIEWHVYIHIFMYVFVHVSVFYVWTIPYQMMHNGPFSYSLKFVFAS